MKKIAAIICLVLVAFVASAQNITVQGTVRDAGGEAVIGALVMLEGSSTTGAVTDINGKYSLSLPATSVNPRLEVSCIGYLKQTVGINGSGTMDFILTEDKEELEEVVVVGYGSMRRSDLTGAVSSVRIDEDNAMKSTTIDQLLDGHAAGIQVLSDNSNPDSGVSIRIRGLSTFTGHSEPLYVVDGVIMEGETSSMNLFTDAVGGNTTSESESTNALAGLNPQDIANIEILKDASATAIYGSQGANGVVLITTKQARKDKPLINFNAGVSVGQAARTLDLLSFDEYVDLVYKYNTSGNYKQYIYTDTENRTGLKVRPIDWQDAIFRTSISQRYYFAIAGKPKGLNFHFSLGYNHNEGIVCCTDSDAFSAKLNMSRNIFKNVTLSFRSTFGYTKSNLINGANDKGSSQINSSIMSTVMSSKPFTSDNVESEDIADSIDDEYRYGPYRRIEGTTNISERFRVTPSLMLDWKLKEWLTFRSTFGTDITFAQSRKTKNNLMSYGHGNIAGVGETLAQLRNWDNLLMFNWKTGQHRISGTLGQSLSSRMRSTQTVSAQELPQEYAYGADINEAATANSYYTSYGESVSTILSFFGRAIYNYADRYVLTTTLRFDGSSKFLGRNKWGVFPSAAFAWRMTSEPWFYVPWISNAKLRLGWGQVGNQNIGSYLTGTTYSSSFNSSHFGNGKILGIYSGNIANEGLKWETTTQENLGLDLSFFRGRLTISADAYNKDTRDLLQTKNVAYSTGFTTMSVNDGWIRNNGLEITVETVPVRSENIEWTIGANISVNRNTIKDVGAMGDSSKLILKEGSEPVQRNFFYGSSIFSSLCTAPVNIFIENEPMGLFYGYVTDGIVQEGETVTGFTKGVYREPGTLKYKDLNNSGHWDLDDRTIIGNPHPKFSYGFNTAFSWKKFSFKVDFSGAYKFDIANMNAVRGYLTNLSRNGYSEAFLEAWTPENRSNVWPKFGTPADDLFSDRYVEDGSYLKISNIAVSYSMRFKKTAKVLHGLAFTLSVGNPVMWTKYSGYNPSTNSFGNNVKRIGVDLNSTPYARTCNFDVKFSF